MTVTKLTVRGKGLAGLSEGMVGAQIMLMCGGMVKRRAEGGLLHYTCEPDRAMREWSLKGWDCTGREDVEMSDDGLSRLLADLDVEPVEVSPAYGDRN